MGGVATACMLSDLLESVHTHLGRGYYAESDVLKSMSLVSCPFLWETNVANWDQKGMQWQVVGSHCASRVQVALVTTVVP